MLLSGETGGCRLLPAAQLVPDSAKVLPELQDRFPLAHEWPQTTLPDTRQLLLGLAIFTHNVSL